LIDVSSRTHSVLWGTKREAPISRNETSLDHQIAKVMVTGIDTIDPNDDTLVAVSCERSNRLHLLWRIRTEECDRSSGRIEPRNRFTGP
jgi:hypothetical protein